MDAPKSVSATFNLSVPASAELSLALSADSATVGVGSNLTYAITVTNHGPSDASMVMVTNTLPETVSLVSIAASQGSQTTNGNVLIFTLGVLTNGGSGVLTIIVTPSAAGTITNRAEVSAAEGDPNFTNNLATVETLVTPAAPINHGPNFSKGPDQTVSEDSGPQTVAGWATGISAGPPEESGQALTFVVINDNNSLFFEGPAVSPDGALTFTPALNANGSATVTVILKDDGGTANGGVDTSSPQTFLITVAAVNDAPVFTKGPDQIVNQAAGPQTIPGWATGIGAGPADESPQTLSFVVYTDYGSLFEAQPAISSDGTLTYRAADNAVGEANVTVFLRDTGGTTNGGVDTSIPQFFKIAIVSPVDLLLLANASPNPVAIGSNLVFQFTVANVRSQFAQGVVVTNPLPANTTFVGATASQGTCMLTSGVVICALGDLGGGMSANISVTVVPNVFGSVVATASVGAKATDVNPANNWASVGVQVLGPPIVVQLVQSGPFPTLRLYVVPQFGYNSFVQYADSFMPNTVWTDLPGGPHSGLLTITNNAPFRFYRTLLVPQ